MRSLNRRLIGKQWHMCRHKCWRPHQLMTSVLYHGWTPEDADNMWKFWKHTRAWQDQLKIPGFCPYPSKICFPACLMRVGGPAKRNPLNLMQIQFKKKKKVDSALLNEVGPFSVVSFGDSVSSWETFLFKFGIFSLSQNSCSFAKSADNSWAASNFLAVSLPTDNLNWNFYIMLQRLKQLNKSKQTDCSIWLQQNSIL